jgi:predicted small metal-binding protein
MNTPSAEDQEANHGRLTFRCLDLGIKDCRWQTCSNIEDEILLEVENHLRERHDFGFATRIMVRRAIRRRAA